MAAEAEAAEAAEKAEEEEAAEEAEEEEAAGVWSATRDTFHKLLKLLAKRKPNNSEEHNHSFRAHLPFQCRVLSSLQEPFDYNN